MTVPTSRGKGLGKERRPAALIELLAFSGGTPDRIRTGATALRGRRARPLHNGGVDHAFPQILLVYLDSNLD